MKWIALSLCVIGVFTELSFGAPTTVEENTPKPEINYRLNEDVWPSEYKIEVTPYFDEKDPEKAFTFDGECTIKISTEEDNIKEITLHIDDLKIHQKTLTESKKFSFFLERIEQTINIKDDKHDDITKKYTLYLEKPLKKFTTYELYFKYTGRLQTDMHGFYRSSYKEGKKTKWLASTQMEPVHARKVFPSFDEPKFKSVFNIIINRPKNFKPSICNTPLKSSKESNGRIQEIFEQSPKMSSYLVAFIVSEFDCRSNGGKSFDVCSRPNAYDQTKYSFNVGQKILAAYDDRFAYKYNKQINKMTMAAIPDFAAGAMENWGLLTYRETALLYDKDGSTSMNQQRVASVVAHEQAHMWFGDLVTCDWWSHTWLNEGFARYFEYFGTAMVETEWGLDQQFVVDQVQKVFGGDSLESSWPLSYDGVQSPEDIANHFGDISYAKGGSVIRMFRYALGEKKFDAAIQRYLKTNALSTSVPEKLFDAFKAEVGNDKDIEKLMKNWIYKAGYPLLTVTVDEDRKKAEIKQKRFLRNKPEHDIDTIWTVPISYATDQENTNFEETEPKIYLEGESMEKEFEEPIDWIILNVQQTGYYRVNYDPDTWKRIANGLHTSHESINVLNRAQIIDDALDLARANQLDYLIALDIANYLTNETEYVPWKSAFNNFDFILARFTVEEAGIFEKYILGLLDTAYNHLGFEPKEKEHRLDVYNRMNILKYACKFNHEQCIKDAQDAYDHSKDKGHAVPVDIRPVVYCSVIQQGSEKEWDELYEKFLNENVAAEQVTILNALGCTKNKESLQKYFDRILSDDIRLQDKDAALKSTMTQQSNLDAVADFVIEKHSDMDEAFEDPAEVPTILSQLASRATTQASIDKIQKFVDDNKLDNAGLKVALENAAVNLKWAEKHLPTLKDFVKSSASTQTISCITFMSLIVLYLLQ